MLTFALIPGAGGIAWYWHHVVDRLAAMGHEPLAIDLPGEHLEEYARRVIDAIGSRQDVVLVAQSLAGFTAPLVCARRSVRSLIFVNAMIPTPGEKVGDWGEHTGSSEARVAAARAGGYSEQFEEATYFLHDVSAEDRAEGESHQRAQPDAIWEDTCDFKRWPDIPIHVIAGRDDRLFPLEFQRRVARERLSRDIDELPGGHLIALSHPRELVDQIIRRSA